MGERHPPQTSRHQSTSTPTRDVPVREKIGQMLIAGFKGLRVDPEHPIARDIQSYNLGGVILYDRDVTTGSRERNIQSPSQVKELTACLQAYSKELLLVSIDQEGGIVNRLPEASGFPPSVSAGVLGDLDDTERTRSEAVAVAASLAQAGINLNMAPVVDLNVNPGNPVIGAKERSYSADPAIVIRHAAEFITAHRDEGVLSCLKHFPGHGSSKMDSHLGMTDVSDTWTDKELEPYRVLIDKGMADSVMISHVFQRRLDASFPATLSSRIINNMLREEMAYDGVVISDDLQMGAIARHFGLETAFERTINAGTDLITLGNNLVYEGGLIGRAFDIIESLVDSGRVLPQQIDGAYTRILRFKDRARHGRSSELNG